MLNPIYISAVRFSLVMIFFCTSSHAAQVIDLRQYQSNGTDLFLSTSDPTSLHKIFGLSDDNRFAKLKNINLSEKPSVIRYQQTFKGIPIWGKQVIIHYYSKTKIAKSSGQIVKDIETDLPDMQSLCTNFDKIQALEKAKTIHIKENGTANWYYKNVVNQKVIYIDSTNKAVLAYEVNFFADSDQGNPGRPYFIFNGQTGAILKQWDGLTYSSTTF